VFRVQDAALGEASRRFKICRAQVTPSSSLLSSLEFSDTQVYEPEIRARLGTAAHQAIPNIG